MACGAAFKAIIGFIKGLFCEPDGTPSSTRVLMYAFAGFSCWLIWRIFYHVFHLPADSPSVSIWLSNIPILIASLVGLISLPYAVNKGTNTLSDIASMITAARQNNNSSTVNTQITGVLANLVKRAQQPTVDPVTGLPVEETVTPPPAVGSDTLKG